MRGSAEDEAGAAAVLGRPVFADGAYDLDPDEAASLAEPLWIVPPGGSLLG
jgi:hypothetical protein